MSVQLEALDILGDLLSRFGGKLISRTLICKWRCYGMEVTHLKYYMEINVSQGSK